MDESASRLWQPVLTCEREHKLATPNCLQASFWNVAPPVRLACLTLDQPPRLPFQKVRSMWNTCWPLAVVTRSGNDRCRWKFKTDKSQKCTLALLREKKQFGHSRDFELGLHANMGKLDLVYNRISLLCSRLKWLNRRILIQLMPKYSSDPVRWNSWDKWTNIEAQAINQSTRSFAYLYRHITQPHTISLGSSP